MKKMLTILIGLLICGSMSARTITVTAGSGTTTYNLTDIQSITFETQAVQENMVLVEGGSFMMGYTGEDQQPIHSVTLSSFLMGKYEIKQNEWIAIMGSNPSFNTTDLNCPVEKVTWYSILVYCNKRSIAEGLTPCYTISGSTDPDTWGAIPTTTNATWSAVTCNWSAKGYRLPTESEWEYAARGGKNPQSYLYSGSNVANDVAWYKTNSLVGGYMVSHPVATRAANSLGIYDMSGNVWEWIWDWYGSSYNAGPETNPTGPASPDPGCGHLQRGGAFTGGMDVITVYNRFEGYPASKYSDLGFRVVRIP